MSVREQEKCDPLDAGSVDRKIEAWAHATRALREELLRAAKGKKFEDKEKATRAATALEQATVFVELVVQGQIIRVTLG